MIKKIQISNYRSCRDTSFTIHPHLSVFIGPNSSGKTNILNAILLLKRLSEDSGYPYSILEDQPIGECKIKTWFDINGKKVIFTGNLFIYTDEHNSDVIVSSRQQWYLKDFTGNAKRLHVPLSFYRILPDSETREFIRFRKLYTFNAMGRKIYPRHYRHWTDMQTREPREPIGTIAQDMAEMRYYSASQFTNPADCPVSFEVEKEGQRSLSPGLKGHTKFLFDLYTEYKSNGSDYEQFFSIVGPEGIGLIDELNFQEALISSTDYSVRSGGTLKKIRRDKILVIPQLTIGRQKLSPNQLSEGTFKTIILIFYIVTQASTILMIEEPEVCVHHGLLSSIMELIKTYSREKQIIISTHSDFVLDMVSPENVFKVSISPDQGTKVAHIPKSMSKQEFAALKKYLNTVGNLGEYWKHGALE